MRAAISAVVLAASLAAQTQICSPLLSGNGQSGNIFDVANVSAQTVTITGIGQNFFAAGTCVYEAWVTTNGGPWNGLQNNAAAWTRVGTTGTTPIAVPGAGTAFTIPFCVNITLAPGQVLGMYLTCTNATGTIVAYTNGTAIGTPLINDGTLEIRSGLGNAYPFGGTFSPRNWNGCLSYVFGTASATYETNDPLSTFTFDTSVGSGCTAAATTVCPNEVHSANFASSQVGAPFETIVTLEGTYPGNGPPAITTANGQIVNVNLFSPTLFWLNGGAAPIFAPHPGAFNFAFNTGPVPFTASAQQAVLTPAHPDGFALSQAGQLTISAGVTSVPGPSGDDVALAIPLGGQPGCGPGSVSFFGSTYTTMQVITNGRVMFGTANTSFTPTAAAALTDAPSIGCWTDFNTATGGNITIDFSVPNTVRVNWNAVAYFGQAGTANTYSIVFDNTTGVVTLANVNTLGAQLVGSALNMWTGASPGLAGGATNSGATAFGPGLSGTPTLPTDEIYIFGTAPQHAGCANIFFVPSGTSYTWAAN